MGDIEVAALDCGSAITKLGIAGEEYPKFVVPTPPGLVKNGHVMSWTDMEVFLNHLFLTKLGNKPAHVLMLSHVLMPKNHRE